MSKSKYRSAGKKVRQKRILVGKKDVGLTCLDKSKQSNPSVVLWICLLAVVSLAVIGAHWPALSAQVLSFDDGQYLTDNCLVQQPGWNSAQQFITEIRPSTVRGYYQPLTMISLMLDCAMGGGNNNLTIFHITSMALHVANTTLVIILLYLLFGNLGASVAVGLLFGVHPMTVETIPWVGERKTLLATFFALLCLIYYIRYAKSQKIIFMVVSLLLYVLSLLSKPTSIPIPAVMLLMDFWPLRRFNIRAVLEKIPLGSIGLIACYITFVSQHDTAFASGPSQQNLLRTMGLLCHNNIFYLCQMIWPTNLSSHYVFPIKPIWMWAGIVGTGILLPLLIISLRWSRGPLTGWLIFFVAIFPTMGVIGFTNTFASDKYAYLPSIGILMLLTSLLIWIGNTFKTTIFPARRAVIIIVVLVLGGIETQATRKYLTHWCDSETFFYYMLELTPHSAPLYGHLGQLSAGRGDNKQAEKHYTKALELNPNHAETYHNLGQIFENRGDIKRASQHYQMAIKLKPKLAASYNNLGNIMKAQGQYNNAIEQYHKALAINKYNFEVHNNLGIVFKNNGQLDDAIESYRQALQLKPGNIIVMKNLAIAFTLRGDFDDAAKYYQKVLQITPQNINIRYSLGDVLIELGHIDEAINHFQRAIQVKNDFVPAYGGLAKAFFKQGHIDLAIEKIQIGIEYAKDDEDKKWADYLHLQLKNLQQSQR